MAQQPPPCKHLTDSIKEKNIQGKETLKLFGVTKHGELMRQKQSCWHLPTPFFYFLGGCSLQKCMPASAWQAFNTGHKEKFLNMRQWTWSSLGWSLLQQSHFHTVASWTSNRPVLWKSCRCAGWKQKRAGSFLSGGGIRAAWTPLPG